MNETVRQTRSYLKELLSQQGVHARTDLGQNFLIDLNLVGYIVEQAEIEDRDVILEVGSGTGGLTTLLAERAAAVISVELDKRLFPLAEQTTVGLENVTLLNCDALRNKNHFAPRVLEKVAANLAEDSARRLKLVSNLPYNIATPVISNLVATELPWERMVTTIQLELAERMTARPGTGNYGALSVWIQSQCRVRILKKLVPNVFWPRPKVQSAIIRVFPDRALRDRIADRTFFHAMLRRLFHQRRKLMRSVLVGMYRKQLQKPEVDAVLQSMDIGPDSRAEQLPAETLVDLSNRIREAIDHKLAVQTLPQAD